MDIDEFMVVKIDEVPIDIQYVGETTREARTKIYATAPQYNDNASGHIFAAVIAAALDNGQRPGIAHCESLAGLSSGKKLATRRTIKAGIADDDSVFGFVKRVFRRPDNDLPSGHALTDVIIGIAHQVKI